MLLLMVVMDFIKTFKKKKHSVFLNIKLNFFTARTIVIVLLHAPNDKIIKNIKDKNIK